MRLYLSIGAALLVCAALVRPVGAEGGYSDAQVSEALTLASRRHGVSRSLLRDVSWCESNWDPSAIGDRGRSHGLFQLNDRSTGLLGHFYEVTNGASPYDPYAAADYFAAVVAGEYPGIKPSRWTCWRLLYG